MARPKKHWPIVQAAQDEARLAVKMFNDPSEPRAFEGFAVHMHLAWLYLLQAVLTRDGVDYRYHRKDNPRLLEKVDGEPKCWELGRCLAHRWPDTTDPTRVNVEFFIGLRNKIEHRFASTQQVTLALAVAGHAQAYLLNFETELTSQFGQQASLAGTLRFPVFIGSFTDAGVKTLLKLRKALPASLRRYIADYHSGLDASVLEDPRFELRLRVVTELAKRDPDALAVQFLRYDEMTEEQKSAAEVLGRKGVVYVREQKRPVASYGLMKPREVVEKVSASIKYEFNMGHFTATWRTMNLRPPGGSDHPERTNDKYCIYDELNGNYGYTQALVDKLCRELTTEDGFRRLVGKRPEPVRSRRNHRRA